MAGGGAQNFQAGMQRGGQGMNQPQNGAPMQTGQQGAPMQGGGPNVFQQANRSLTGAVRGTREAMNYNPMQITPNTLAGQNLNPYMNPFQQQVTDQTMRQLGQQQAGAINNLDAAASAAGAFGGSRHGVALGETNRGYADAQAQTLAGLNSANFQQAQQGATFDVNNRNQAQQFNSNQGLAGQNLNLAAAGQLGNLSNLGFGQGMQINNQQAQQGAQQQALQQMLMNQAMQQFGGFTGAPAQSVAQLLGGVGGVPYGTTGTNRTTNQPGLFDYLSLGLSL
jgi:hypothetical protein